MNFEYTIDTMLSLSIEWDEEDGGWLLCLWVKGEDIAICFACEDIEDSNRVVITDHGLIPQQYIPRQYQATLNSIGLYPGKSFESMDKVKEYLDSQLA